MRLYRVGDQGEPVRDIQDRLSLLGFGCGPDTPGEYGKATAGAVATFQRSRGLSADGIVGPDTWRVLYEAGYVLGDRLLYLRRPMLRGEDVAELQRRLNSLGFDAGKVDGIFGQGDGAGAARLPAQPEHGRRRDCGPPGALRVATRRPGHREDRT